MSLMIRPWVGVVETAAYLARAPKIFSEVEREAVVQDDRA